MTNLIAEATTFLHENIPSSRKSEPYLKHAELVTEYVITLGKEYNADIFSLQVAALLHDVGADAGPNHAQESAEIVDEFLNDFNQTEYQKQKIISAIKNHSLSYDQIPNDSPIEDQVLRDADGIAFLQDTFVSYYEFEAKNGNTEEAKRKTLEKIEKSFNKIRTQKGMEFAIKFYTPAKEIVSKH